MKFSKNRIRRATGPILTSAALALLGSCASTTERDSADRVTDLKDRQLAGSLKRPDRAPLNTDEVGRSDPTAPPERGQSNEITVPSVAAPELELQGGTDFAEPAPVAQVQSVDAVVPALPVPQFIDVVFGEMLGVPYTTGPGVAEKTELVQLRSSGRMDSGTFVELVSRSLEDYGLRVYAENGAYQIVTDATLQSRMPRFIKSRSRADIPEELRPVVQFVELQAIAANEMEGILRQAFPDQDLLKIEANPRVNVLTLTGLPRDLDSALSIIDQLDELAYAGSTAERYSPVFWSAQNLAAEVASLLEAEGWQASTNKAVQKPILIIPVEYSNDIFIFSRQPAGLARTRFWLAELDRPSRRGNERQTFVYDVQNVDAQLLAEILDSVLSRQRMDAEEENSRAPANTGTPGDLQGGTGNSTGGRSNRSSFGSVVVNTLSNQILFTGTPSQYDQIRPLLVRLDTSPAEVMIEVTVAEITLTDDTNYGVEFFLDSLGDSNFSGTISNEGLGLGGVGTNVGIITGNVNAAINFFARNNLLNVLSTPRLTTRSGGAAQIQVGSDVPIITSQRAAETQDGTGGTDILQSVDYRSTGVLLSIEPIVFGDNRVDLDITQEVSTAIPTTSSQISSPTISNRSVTTQLSLQDGATAVLGGLIQNNITRDEAGTPILKDVPVVGNLFRNTTISNTRTELIVLITAYVIRGPEDKQAFTDELVDRFSRTELEAQDLQTYIGQAPLD